MAMAKASKQDKSCEQTIITQRLNLYNEAKLTDSYLREIRTGCQYNPVVIALADLLWLTCLCMGSKDTFYCQVYRGQIMPTTQRYSEALEVRVKCSYFVQFWDISFVTLTLSSLFTIVIVLVDICEMISAFLCGQVYQHWQGCSVLPWLVHLDHVSFLPEVDCPYINFTV